MMLIAFMATLAAGAQENVYATWDFTTNPLELSSSVTGTYTLESNGVTLTIDATNGKIRDNSNSYQFYTGVVIQVPVTSARDTVTVEGYPGYYSYTVNGEEATSATTVHRATSAEVEQGYVEIVSTGDNNYIISIELVQVSAIQEKQLYVTDFSDWCDYAVSATTSEKNVTWTTKYSYEDLTFTVYDSQITCTNQNTSKFPDWDGGYIMAAKSDDPYIVTSALASITKVAFTHGATGSNRGWALYAKGDGDDDWVALSTSIASTYTGTDVEVAVNRTNCQLKFTNLNSAQNAYLFYLDIYGYVDMSSSPSLASLTANGTTYQAADIFDQNSDGNYEATIEISKSDEMISESNPLTDVTAENGDIGDITYTIDDEGQCLATIPVTYSSATAYYYLSCEWKPDYTVYYYDADYETLLGSQTVEKDAAIGSFDLDGSTATVDDGDKFRGWLIDTETGEKADAETIIDEDGFALYALVTDIEGDEPNERNKYDLKNEFFYVEDHEGFIPKCTYSYNGSTHGMAMSSGNVQLLTGGNATIIIEACRYNGVDMVLTTSDGTVLGTIAVPSTDGTKTTISYTGEADTLVLSFDGQIYLHSVTVISTGESTIEKNDAGYYVAEAGSADSFRNILDIIEANESGSERVKVFLPNGTYDLGTDVETTLPCNRISFIGESMYGTIILTTPPVSKEGLGSADMFYNTRSYIYWQDLTLQNDLDYYGSGSAGRAAVLQDRGNYTIGKNINMMSYQDTYYSQNSSQKAYWEGCNIHGTVDFICGGGDVRFQDCTITLENRQTSGSGGRTITAPTTTTNYGYVFDGCTIVDLSEGKGEWNFGRTWNNNPINVYLNTTFDAVAEQTIISTRWTAQGMNSTDPKVFGEYNTMDEDGNDITPTSNVITSYGGDFETILTADEAATYDYDNMFTSWDPKSDAAQIEMGELTVSGTSVTWDAVEGATAYAVAVDDVFQTITTGTSYTLDEAADDSTYITVRAANEMGGFGEAATYGTSTGIGNVVNEQTNNVVSIRYYNTSGMRITGRRQGITIRVKTMSDGSKVTEKILSGN